MNPSDTKKSLLGMLPEEIASAVKGLGLPSYAAAQIIDWVYRKRVTDIAQMSNLSQANRTLLAEHYRVGRAEPTQAVTSQDGTVKYLFPVAGGAVESVFIPEADRATLCVSSQVGCKMNCLFCQTGKQGFKGHLSAGEILNQIYSVPQADSLTNVVFMGMGEPMDNIDAVLRATTLLTHSKGYAWSPKRITVSTIGVEPGLTRFLRESSCNLAVSLHNPIPAERLSLMPMERALPIEQLVHKLSGYDFRHQRRLTFEYIVFSGLNDTMLHVRELTKLLSGLSCHVNLIRYHRIPGIDLPATDPARAERLRDALSAKGIPTTIRTSRGEDIWAACGMLSSLRTEQHPASDPNT